jgi:hypothetical protein
VTPTPPFTTHARRYDNPWIYVTTLVTGIQGVSSLAQIHGRSIRKNSEVYFKKGGVIEFPWGNKSILVFPKLPDLEKAVEGCVCAPAACLSHCFAHRLGLCLITLMQLATCNTTARAPTCTS